MDKAAREKARQLAERRKEAMKSWSLGGMAHDKELADACLPLLDALDAADSDNARLRARVSELEAALRTAIKVAGEAQREWDAAPNGMKAGKLLIALSDSSLKYRADITAMHKALPAPPVGDR